MTTVSPPDPFRPGLVLKQFVKYASKSALPTLLKMVKTLDKAEVRDKEASSGFAKPIVKDPLPKGYKYGEYPW